MTTPRFFIAVACVAGVTVALGCGAADPPASVLDRAAAADSDFGVRYRFRSRSTDGEGTYRVRGYGQAEADQRRTRTVFVDGDERGESVIDGREEYRGGSFAIGRFLLDAPSRNVRWTKLDRARFLDGGFIDYLCGPELPAKIAGVLAATDPAIERRGAARVGGVRTRRYRVTTTYGKVLDELAGDDDASGCDKADRAARLVADVWIDRDDLVRRVRLRYRRVDGLYVETRDITRYDRDVHVTVPSGPAVGDITDAMLKLANRITAECKKTDDC